MYLVTLQKSIVLIRRTSQKGSTEIDEFSYGQKWRSHMVFDQNSVPEIEKLWKTSFPMFSLADLSTIQMCRTAFRIPSLNPQP